MKRRTPLKDLIINLVHDGFDRQVEWRRTFHQYPELSLQEFKTTDRIRKLVKRLGLVELPIDMETGLLAELRGQKPGPTVAIRTDIDALPVTEQTGLPFTSKVDGCMHACGHDVHMATILGTAAVLKHLRQEMTGTVRFIFQPAEEKPPGGARPMIANGALDDVSMLFGMHVDPSLAVGKVSTRDGVTMGSVMDFNLTVSGQGGHAARPHTAIDAIPIAAEAVNSIQRIVSRETDPGSPVVITFGTIQGGTARNVIADSVTLEGTIRTLSKSDSRRVPRLVKRVATNVCKAHGASADVQFVAEYPVLANNPRVNRLLESTYDDLFGKGKREQTEATLAGEDFACYLPHVPGAMFRLGIRNRKIGADKPWHSPLFVVDENAMRFGTALLAAAAVRAVGGTE